MSPTARKRPTRKHHHTAEEMHPDDAALVARRAELIPMPDRHDVRFLDVIFDAVFLGIGLARANAAFLRDVDRRLATLERQGVTIMQDLSALEDAITAVDGDLTTMEATIAKLNDPANQADPAKVAQLVQELTDAHTSAQATISPVARSSKKAKKHG